MLTHAEAKGIAAEITARERLYRLNPSMAPGCRPVSYKYRCPELHPLSTRVHGQVYDHAMVSLYNTHAYHQLLIAALISVAAVCLLTPMDTTNTLLLAALTLSLCSGTLLFRLVFVRRAMKLIATELARHGAR